MKLPKDAGAIFLGAPLVLGVQAANHTAWVNYKSQEDPFFYIMPNPRSKGFTTQYYFHPPANQGIFSFQPLFGGCNLGIEEIVNAKMD